MNQLEINKQRARLLTTARTLLNDEYQKKRSEQFTKWQTESNHLWISQGIMLPYPSSFGYPTEEEIVTRALELYNTQKDSKPESSIELPKTDISMTASVTERLMEVSRNVKPVVLPEVPEPPSWEDFLAPQTAAQSLPANDVLSEPIIPVPESDAVPEPVVENIITKEETEPELTEEQIEEVKSNSRLRSLLAQFITMAKVLDAKAKKDEGTPI